MNNSQQSLLEIFLNDASFKNWAKKTNQNDIVFWESWIGKHPDKIETIYLAKSMITGVNFNKTPISTAKVNTELKAVLDQISSEAKNGEERKILPIQAKSSSRFLKYAAVAAIGLLFFALGSLTFIDSSEVTHKTDFGEIIELKLPDGTSVVLNGNSEISYDKGSSRDINLKGEAYFKVESIPSTKAKFWVTTKDLTVEVYGTQFHVNTREKKTDVLLDEGSIQLKLENGATKKMIPGEFISFSKASNTITHKKVTTELPYSLWREGTYVFNHITLQEVMKNIEHAYGLEVEFIDEDLKKQVLTGGIPNQNLSICLSAIEKSTGTRIVKKGNRLLLFKNSIN